MPVIPGTIVRVPHAFFGSLLSIEHITALSLVGRAPPHGEHNSALSPLLIPTLVT